MPSAKDQVGYYDTIGVGRIATQDEIQRAYRKLARAWHPDVNRAPEAENRFKQISEAYDVLSDPDRRAKYDAFGPDFRQVPDGTDPTTWAQAQRAARSQRRGGGARATDRAGRDVFVDFGDLGGPSPPIDELFESLFGQDRRSSGPRRGLDHEVEVEVTLRDAYRGGQRTFSLSRPDLGQKSRQYTVTIPAGVIDGQRIRLAGQGSPSRDGGPAGDLYLVLRLASEQRFRVLGRNISMDLRVSPWEAALGATVAVDTPDGDAKVKIPPGTSSGQKLRLRGLGLTNPNGDSGDLYAVIQIVLPDIVSEAERELFAQLAAVSNFDPRQRP